MKINSTTHMTILFTFALVFVVIYLYYTITDVRKMSAELKKVTQDIQTLTATVSKLNNEVAEVQKLSVDVNKVFSMNDMLTQELNGILNNQISITTGLPQSAPAVCADDVCPIPDDKDETESVDTADLKKMLNDDDDQQEPTNTPVDDGTPISIPPSSEVITTKPASKKVVAKKVK